MGPTSLSAAELPKELASLRPAVEELFLWGQLPPRPRVALVGTRSPTPEAMVWCRTVAQELTAQGVSILSGGALGIDATAHRACLEAEGQTLVVGPSGLDDCFPKEHESLFRAIVASGGGYLSLAPGAHKSARVAFFRRNAVLAALTDALVVVQAPLRSGARNASAWARRFRRVVQVVPSAPWVVEGRGCIEELRLGVPPFVSVSNLLRVLDMAPRSAGNGDHEGGGSRGTEAAAVARREQLTLPGVSVPSGRQRQVLEAIAEGCRYVDDVQQVTGLVFGELQRELLLLGLEGWLRLDPSGVIHPLRGRSW